MSSRGETQLFVPDRSGYVFVEEVKNILKIQIHLCMQTIDEKEHWHIEQIAT